MQDVSQRRREALKYEIHPSYRGLCAPPKIQTEELFGPNLNDRVKELAETNKMSNQLAAHQNNYKAPKHRPSQGAHHRGGYGAQGGQNRKRHAPYTQSRPHQQREPYRTQKSSKGSAGMKKPYHHKKVSNNWQKFVDTTIKNGFESSKNFKAGQVRQKFWKTMTSRDNLPLTFSQKKKLMVL